MEKKTIWDLDRPDVATYRRRPKMPVTLVLDNVRSLNNIGSMFRTADAFAVKRIFLCGISATPPSPEIHKTALGAEDSVEWTYFAETADAIAALRSEGVTVCCLEQVKRSVSLQQFCPEPDRGYAIVVGHEVDGVSQGVVDLSDVCLEIPQSGTKHSLNVAVSAGVALWHFYERWISNK